MPKPKSALITGASSGIGESFARVLAADDFANNRLSEWRKRKRKTDMRLHWTIFVVAILSGFSVASCKSRPLGETGLSTSENLVGNGANPAITNEPAPYETVNGLPQMSASDSQFSFYWGIWRGISPSEKALILASPQKQASLVSRRSVVWDIHDCATSALLHRNHEEFYFLDNLELENDKLRPLREAVRPGWRYFSMGTFNSLFAREGSDIRSQQDLKKLQSRRGQRGQVMIQAEHKFFTVPPADLKSSFVSFFDYRADDARLLDGVFAPFNPYRWPVYYDERAHKPHSINEPEIWRTVGNNDPRTFNARLVWNWCENGEKPVAYFEVGPDDLPPPGPNRPGRTDSGTTELPLRQRGT